MKKITFLLLLWGFSFSADASRVWTEWFKVSEINQINHGAFYIKPKENVLDPICWYVRFQENQIGTDVKAVSRALSLGLTALLTDRYIKVEYENFDSNCFAYNITIK